MARADALVNLDDAYSFDPARSQWKRLHPLPRANRGLTATVVDDRYIVLYGGYTATQQEAAGQGPASASARPRSSTISRPTRIWKQARGLWPRREWKLCTNAGIIFVVGGEQRMRGRSDRLMTAPVRQ